MNNDFLLELGTEELPSASVWPLVEALANQLVVAFEKAHITHGAVHRFATPRRLAVWIEQVAEEQPTQTIQRRGPGCAQATNEQGEPLPPLLGFAKSCGVSLSELTILSTDKGSWWVHEATTPGANTRTILPALVNEVLLSLPIKKPMRWGDGEVEFARPVHWVVLLLGDAVVPGVVLGVATGRVSRGHRFHHPDTVSISNPFAYESLMTEAHVMADFSKRRETILAQVTQLGLAHGCHPEFPEALLDEVTSIVEWPHALLAQFDPAFLDVPAEALIASMQSHQKCVALRDTKGDLLPCFITVSNIDSSNPQSVISGNETVMRARLSDAAFFYRQDQKHPLASYYEATAQVMFQARLGSLQDKMSRLKQLMIYLSSALTLDMPQAIRAAELSKCDLMTGMVGEFPELQGLMGFYYARIDGEPLPVAHALNEQYMPRFAADALPASLLGMALSFADRLDTLVGTFAIGQKPTGVKDPFKLRRHALAVIRLMIATEHPLTLSMVLRETAKGYADAGLNGAAELVLEEIKSFILERLPAFYQLRGIAPEFVAAVSACQSDCLSDLDARVTALLHFASLPEAQSLAAACKRVGHLLQKAALPKEAVVCDVAYGQEPAEQVLYSCLQRVEDKVRPWYVSGNYADILTELASLRDPVDAFFEQVMVMVDDPIVKNNRLRLLLRLQSVLQGVADISLL